MSNTHEPCKVHMTQISRSRLTANMQLLMAFRSPVSTTDLPPSFHVQLPQHKLRPNRHRHLPPVPLAMMMLFEQQYELVETRILRPTGKGVTQANFNLT